MFSALMLNTRTKVPAGNVAITLTVLAGVDSAKQDAFFG
jgi:hypothetical protein